MRTVPTLRHDKTHEESTTDRVHERPVEVLTTGTTSVPPRFVTSNSVDLAGMFELPSRIWEPAYSSTADGIPLSLRDAATSSA